MITLGIIKDRNFADLYSDYLINSSSYTTTIGMASLLSIKHDKITRELSTGNYDSKFYKNKQKCVFKNQISTE